METPQIFPAVPATDGKKEWLTPKAVEIEKKIITAVPVPGVVDAGAYIS